MVKIYCKNYLNSVKSLENILFSKYLFNIQNNFFSYNRRREKVKNFVKVGKVMLENVKFEKINESFFNKNKKIRVRKKRIFYIKI